MNIGTALRQGSEMLERGGVDVPRLTAEVLLCHALHCERPWLYAHTTEELPERAWIHFGRYLDERLRGKPTQYITGIQEFYGRTFRVTRDVLIPRPETEHLVEAALKYLSEHPGAAVLDVGTGSGAIAVTLALEARMPVIASDLSTAALTVAKRNADALGAPVRFFTGDLLSCLRPASFDFIVSNPPYIGVQDRAGMQAEVRDWEPAGALFAGADGVGIYQRLLEEAGSVLRPHGLLMLELGYSSLEPVRRSLRPVWKELEVISDLAGWPRVLVLELCSGSVDTRQ